MGKAFIRVMAGLFRYGADASLDPRRSKRIILSNQISISIALLSLPFAVIYLRSGAGLMGGLELPIVTGYASVHRLNKAGHTRFSRLFLITLANLDIFTYTLSMGTSTQQHLFFLLAGWAPLVLFDWEERKSILYGIFLSSILFIGTEVFVPYVGLFEPVAAESLSRMRLLQMITLETVQSLLIFYFFRGNRTTEMTLAVAGEAARSADEAKSRFLARMSDEIRSPLNEILSLSHLLIKTNMGPERRETLDDIQVSAQDLLSIVDEILDLSRIESGKMRLEREPFSPMRLGHSVLRPFEFEAGRKRLELTLDADPGLPGHLFGDAARLKQVLRNLVGNAFKFTEAGKVVLRIRYGPAESGTHAEVLACEIEDTGIGIPEEARARIFEPFTQGDTSTTRKYGGTGLGLFISRQIVELMGGSLGFRPAGAGGTVFHFQVPLERAPDPPGETPWPARGKPLRSAETHPAEPRPGKPARPDYPDAGRHLEERLASASAEGFEGELPASARSLRILVVDDHALNRKLLNQFLASYGLDADVAATAEEALEACAGKAYHVVFMDCHMPAMDGYECTRRLRQGPRAGARPTIIGVTADAMENNLRRCLDAGMDALLVKPIMERQLRGLLAECAGRLG